MSDKSFVKYVFIGKFFVLFCFSCICIHGVHMPPKNPHENLLCPNMDQANLQMVMGTV